nr:sugar ABC transporter permease [Spiractinospora alimapuensis]
MDQPDKHRAWRGGVRKGRVTGDRAPAADPRDRASGGRAKPAPGGRGLARRRRLTPYALLAPSFTLLVVVLVWPIVHMVWMSLHRYSLPEVTGAREPEWNNFQHYLFILTDERFWTIFRNTVLVCLLMVFITMVLGTLVGLLMNRLPNWLQATVGTTLMLAWATPIISAAIVHRWMFDSRYGLVNPVLDALPNWLVGSNWSDFNWLNDPVPFFSVLILTVVWQAFPFVAVTVLAGLKSVPNELYEAARVDGASRWQTFWRVTVPILRPLFALLIVLQVIWDFRIFTQLFILAGGFSNREIFLLPYYAYQLGFASTPQNYGMGSAISVVMTVLVLGITAYYIRIMVRQGEVR